MVSEFSTDTSSDILSTSPVESHQQHHHHQHRKRYNASSLKSPTSVLSNITIPKQQQLQNSINNNESSNSSTKLDNSGHAADYNKDSGVEESEETGLMTRKQLFNPFDSDEEESDPSAAYQQQPVVHQSKSFPTSAPARRSRSPPSMSTSPEQREFIKSAVVESIQKQVASSSSNSLSNVPCSSTSSLSSITSSISTRKTQSATSSKIQAPENNNYNRNHHQSSSTSSATSPALYKRPNSPPGTGTTVDKSSGSNKNNLSSTTRSPDSPTKHSPPKPKQYKYENEDIWLKQDQSKSNSHKLPSVNTRPSTTNITSSINKRLV